MKKFFLLLCVLVLLAFGSLVMSEALWGVASDAMPPEWREQWVVIKSGWEWLLDDGSTDRPLSAPPTGVSSGVTPVSLSATPVLQQLTPVRSVPPPPNVGPMVLAQELLVGPSTIEEVSGWLGAVMRNYVQVEEVEAALSQPDLLRDRTTWWWDDLNGDGHYEWVVQVKVPGLEASLPWGAPAKVWVADSVAQRVVYEAASETFGALEVLALQDLTGDGLSEVLYEIRNCGAHTCYQAYYLLSYHQSDAPRLLHFSLANQDQDQDQDQDQEQDQEQDQDQDQDQADNTSPLANMPSSEWAVEDWTGDGLPDLVLSGGMIGSATLGLQRARTEVYAWDGELMSLAEVRYQPSDLRYFKLLDGNNAFASGDYNLALLLYDEAATSSELKESQWRIKESDASEPFAIQQYAGFRLVLNFLVQDDIEKARFRLDWQLNTFPDTPMSKAAQLLYDEYRESRDLVAACAAVTKYLLIIPDVTSPLDDMGETNPKLTAETLCPIGE